jgi:hypothetical protein
MTRSDVQHNQQIKPQLNNQLQVSFLDHHSLLMLSISRAKGERSTNYKQAIFGSARYELGSECITLVKVNKYYSMC